MMSEEDVERLVDETKSEVRFSRITSNDSFKMGMIAGLKLAMSDKRFDVIERVWK